jgi:serine/threonine-protein kinase HipA
MTVGKLGLDDDANSQTFRRMAFNVMARNCDDHTKNFGFRLNHAHSWELAPAYDVTHAYNPNGEWTYQHLMSVNGKFQDIARADLLEVAGRFGVRRPEDILADVRAAVNNWPNFAAEAGILAALADRVAKDHLPI